MRGASQFVSARQSSRAILGFLAAASFAVITVAASAQMWGGPHSTTQINGHFLAPPATVTSPSARHTPNALPSVTSIPNYGGYHYHYGPYFNGSYRGGRGYRNGGWAYAIPYYYPADNSAYGYDYVGGGDGGAGPDLYSGPPVSPYDPTLHIIAEQPPANPYPGDYAPEPQAYAPPMAPTPPIEDAKPGEPIVLVFRNGNQQEVTNYAIMGDTVYVFDKGSKKIAVADLDIPATVKANDDRGVDFRMPPTPTTTKKAKTPAAPQTTTPAPSTDAPSKIAALEP